MAAIEQTIAATLGAIVSGRCYPLIAPANVVKPYLTYQVISNIPYNDLDGPTGAEQRRLQVDIWGTTYAEVKTLETAAKQAMQGANFINIPVSTGDLYEPETQLYRITMDFSVWI